jgi:hypothetical protein
MCRCLQVTLAEYLADLMPASFKGNETAAEIEASPVWKDPAHEWIVANKVLRLSERVQATCMSISRTACIYASRPDKQQTCSHVASADGCYQGNA